jgi:hypothetical protein
MTGKYSDLIALAAIPQIVSWQPDAVMGVGKE